MDISSSPFFQQKLTGLAKLCKENRQSDIERLKQELSPQAFSVLVSENNFEAVKQVVRLKKLSLLPLLLENFTGDFSALEHTIKRFINRRPYLFGHKDIIFQTYLNELKTASTTPNINTNDAPHHSTQEINDIPSVMRTVATIKDANLPLASYNSSAQSAGLIASIGAEPSEGDLPEELSYASGSDTAESEGISITSDQDTTSPTSSDGETDEVDDEQECEYFSI